MRNDLDWFWEYLHDVYKEPKSYIYRKNYFRWASYTAFFLDELEKYVKSYGRRFGIKNAIIRFQKKVDQMADLEMARAGHAVSQSALDVWYSWKGDQS